ncbi:MAG: AAA family ATPase [Planctomycetota bacterium]
MSNPFADTGDGTARDTGDGAIKGQGADLFSLGRRALRGRWLIAIGAAAALALPAALFGYTSATIQYASSVSVEVLATPELTLYNEFRTNNERIRDYVRRQEFEIRGQRVLETAVSHPALSAVGWPTGTQGQRDLGDSILIDYRGNDSNFRILSITEDPDLSTAAIEAIVDTYRDIQFERNSPEARERQLKQDILGLDGQISRINDSIDAATAEFGTSDLVPLIQDERQRRRGLENGIASIEDALLLRRQASDTVEEIDPDDLAVEQLAEQDGELAKLLAGRDAREAEIAILSENLGRRHPEIRRKTQELASIERRIDDRVAIIREQLAKEGIVDVPGGLSIDELESQLQLFQRRLANADEELGRLNKTAKDIERDQSELTILQERRAELADRLSKLDIERENIQRGRIEIAPIAPATVFDDKRKPFAMAGFMLGGAAGFGLVVAYGVLRRSFRFVEDIDDPSRLPPLLGTLPALDKKDPDAERIAAVSVHNLRNTLHSISRYNDNECQVIVCTSAEPGDGKTTLVQSLGASYALTGLRTIIVDLDLVGGGLSARLGMSGRRGVADLLGGLEPTKCIKRTATEKLYALPAGDATACKPEQLAHRPIQQVTDWLRERFDIVIMDTGPVLGSLEAGLAVGLTDQVLLVVPRGQPERLATAAITRLRRLGGDNIGLVFNRADTIDLKQSLSAASIGAPSLRQTQRKIHERRLDQDASIVGSIPPPQMSQATDASPPPRRAAEDGTGL